MRKRMPDRTKIAVCLCAVMLVICLLALGSYLRPVLCPAETRGDAFGMVLIDIADQETADSYHVQDCGVYVLAVQEKSLAHLAGVSSGDLLTAANDLPVQSTGEFVALQEGFVLGMPVQLQFNRSTGSYAISLVWNEE